MSKLFLIPIIIVLAIGITIPDQVRTYDLENGLKVIETTHTESINALALLGSRAVCKTQSHKVSYVQNGDEKAWHKLTGTNGCWSVCIELDNSSRSKGADAGWSVTWSTSSLGGFSCTTTSKIRDYYAHVNGPGANDQYLSYNRLLMKVLDPLDYNWLSWSEPE